MPDKPTEKDKESKSSQGILNGTNVGGNINIESITQIIASLKFPKIPRNGKIGVFMLSNVSPTVSEIFRSPYRFTQI